MESNPLIHKLELFGRLSDEDKGYLNHLVRHSRLLGGDQDIIREGECPNDVHLVIEGLACRYKLLTDGTRQIMAYLIPGDLCDYHIFILKEMDHSIGTLTPTRIVDIPRKSILDLLGRPALARAFWWMTLVDEATLREWLVNIGQRSSTQRIAHLFCELHLRMKAVGLVDGNRFSLPITQAELADTMGISSVHANRSLQELRGEGLITFKAREVVIDDLARLKKISGFNPNYLHLTGGKQD